MNFKKFIITLLTFSALPSLAFGFLDEEGKLTAKFRIFGAMTDGKQTLPAATSTRGIAAPQKMDKITNGGFGGEVATEIFMNDNIAAELAMGLGSLSTKKTEAVAYNFSEEGSAKQNKPIYTVPVSALIKFFPAPFGAVSPYVGVGYHYNFLFTKSKYFEVNNTSGLVLQAGVDLVTKDDMMYSLDVKQYFADTKLKYKAGTIVDAAQTAKVKLNPLVVSFGMGYKF